MRPMVGGVAANRAQQVGGYAALGLLVLAVVMGAVAAEWSEELASTGVLLLLAAPMARVMTVMWMFTRAREWKYVALCAGVLGVVAGATLAGAR